MAAWNPEANDIFLKAMESASPEDRSAYLDETCHGQAELRGQVDALLAASARAGSFLESPAAGLPSPSGRGVGGEGIAATQDEPISERPGTVIGPYKLLEQIGEGGFGVVFMAEQQHPVRRKVALKVIKPGMDTRQVIARFEAERQALAIMDHPNIAKVFDAGATASSRPYFVMELVKGTSVTEFCDEAQLTPRQRLELFIDVCHAVQHAHQKGIIHRDLKPSNVLVSIHDGKPSIKVIDFGIGKATGAQFTDKTLFTGFAQMIGTPLYMSPEQAGQSLDIDTRSDIYSLGVLLYELLTGTTPFDKERFKQAAYDEIRRIIREEDPPKPSTRLSELSRVGTAHHESTNGGQCPPYSLASVSAQRHTEPAKLTKLMRGELDWIVMKALEKDRSRRYETANGFAADLQRYLNDEPVQACPPSAVYRFRKFARRNKRILASAAVIVLALVAGTAVSTWQAIRATEAEGLAEERLETANANYRTAEEQRQQAEASERDAKTQERLAKEAQKEAKTSAAQALKEKARADQETEFAQDALARALYEQVRALRLSQQPGRRWQALDALKDVERLRRRPRTAAPPAELLLRLPTRTELRTEALAALLLPDARIVQELRPSMGQFAISPDGRLAVTREVKMEEHKVEMQLMDLVQGRELGRWAEKDPYTSIAATAMALSADAKLLASAMMVPPEIHVSELSSRKLVQKLTWSREPSPDKKAPPEKKAEGPLALLEDFAPHGVVTSVAFSPDATHLAAVVGTFKQPSSFEMLLWKLSNRAGPTRIALSEPQQPTVPIFSADGNFLAYPSADKVVTLWSLEKDAAVEQITFEVPVLGPLAISPDGRLLAALVLAKDQHFNLLFWDVPGNREHSRRLVKVSDRLSLAFSPDGSRLALADGRGRRAILSMTDGQEILLQEPSPDMKVIDTQVGWGPGGKHLLTAERWGSFKKWELVADHPHAAVDTGLKNILAFDFSPDSRSIAVATPAKTVLVEGASGRKRLDLPGGGSAVLFRPDGRQVALFGLMEAKLFDVDTGKEVARLTHKDFLQGMFRSAGFSADGRLLALRSMGALKESAIYDVATNKEIWRLPKNKLFVPTLGQLSPDGRLCVVLPVLGQPEEVSLRQLPEGRKLSPLKWVEGPACFPTDLCTFSPDSRRLAIVVTGIAQPFFLRHTQPAGQTVNPGVLIWELTAREKPLRIRVPSLPTVQAFSSDGRLLAIGFMDSSVQLWNAKTGEELFRWAAFEQPAKLHLAFTPDGQALAASSSDSARIQLLHLTDLRRQLAAIGLDW